MEDFNLTYIFLKIPKSLLERQNSWSPMPNY